MNNPLSRATTVRETLKAFLEIWQRDFKALKANEKQGQHINVLDHRLLPLVRALASQDKHSETQMEMLSRVLEYPSIIIAYGYCDILKSPLDTSRSFTYPEHENNVLCLLKSVQRMGLLNEKAELIVSQILFEQAQTEKMCKAIRTHLGQTENSDALVAIALQHPYAIFSALKQFLFPEEQFSRDSVCDYNNQMLKFLLAFSDAFDQIHETNLLDIDPVGGSFDYRNSWVQSVATKVHHARTPLTRICETALQLFP